MKYGLPIVILSVALMYALAMFVVVPRMEYVAELEKSTKGVPTALEFRDQPYIIKTYDNFGVAVNTMNIPNFYLSAKGLLKDKYKTQNVGLVIQSILNHETELSERSLKVDYKQLKGSLVGYEVGVNNLLDKGEKQGFSALNENQIVYLSSVLNSKDFLDEKINSFLTIRSSENVLLAVFAGSIIERKTNVIYKTDYFLVDGKGVFTDTTNSVYTIQNKEELLTMLKAKDILHKPDFTKYPVKEPSDHLTQLATKVTGYYANGDENGSVSSNELLLEPRHEQSSGKYTTLYPLKVYGSMGVEVGVEHELTTLLFTSTETDNLIDKAIEQGFEPERRLDYVKTLLTQQIKEGSNDSAVIVLKTPQGVPISVLTGLQITVDKVHDDLNTIYGIRVDGQPITMLDGTYELIPMSEFLQK